MTPITITVASLEYPKEGRKQGRIIDSTGKSWGVWANEVANYQQFATYEILEYKANDFKGKTYYTIVTAKKVGGPAPAPQPRPTTPMQSALNGGTYVNTDDVRRMDIYTCGAFNNIMANPNVNPLEMTSEQMIAIMRKIISTWKLTLGPQANAVTPATFVSEDMSDSIPF